MRTMMLVTVAAIVAGCAAPRSGGEDVGALTAGSTPPEDFRLDLTVLSTELDAADARPAHLRTARYTLNPGGDLHYTSEPELTSSTAAPYVRTLRRSAVEAVWGLVAPLLAETERPARGSFDLEAGEEGTLSRLLVVFAGGERFQWRAVSDAGAAGEDPIISEIARTLAALAWAEDEPDASVFRIPRRYDFGPDPYARYRAIEPAAEQGGDDPGGR